MILTIALVISLIINILLLIYIYMNKSKSYKPKTECRAMPGISTSYVPTQSKSTNWYWEEMGMYGTGDDL